MTAPRDLIVGIVSASVERRCIDGDNLANIRGLMNVSQAKFAEYCRWDQSYQCRLERLGKHDVCVETADKVLVAMDHFAEKKAGVL